MKAASHLATVILGIVSAIRLLYVVAYLVLLIPTPPFVEPEKGNFVLRRMQFRVGGRGSEIAFWPLIEMDHRLRPKFWCDVTDKGKRWE